MESSNVIENPTLAPVTLTKMQKLIKAEMFGRRQLKALDIRLHEINIRLTKCKETGPKSHRYMLRQRKKVTENVRHMYGIYVQRKTMAVARMILHNFAQSTLSGLNRNNNSEADDSSTVVEEEDVASADSSVLSDSSSDSDDSNASSLDVTSDIENIR